MTMRHPFVIATAAVLGLAASLPAMSQTTQTTETTTTTTVKKGHHNYIYYGDHDIYFAPETKVYYWREGDAWRSGSELPVESRTYVTSGGVKIDLETERPYERNEWVVEHYKKGHDRDDRDDRDHDH